MSVPYESKPAFKFWLETDEGYVFGPGVYSLLKKVMSLGTIKDAAKSLGMSYRFAWGLLKKAEQKIGQPLIHSHKGGKRGGGGAELNQVGINFIEHFEKIRIILNIMSNDQFAIETMKPVNQINAEVIKIQSETDYSKITLKVFEPVVLDVFLNNDLIKKKDVDVGNVLNLRISVIAQDIQGK